MLSHSCAHAAPVGSARFHPARSTCCCALRDPARSSVSVEKYSCSAVPAAVLTFFIAGLLYLLCFEHVDTWERTPHPVRRPAFSSHLITTIDNNGLISTCPTGSRWITWTLNDSLRNGGG